MANTLIQFPNEKQKFLDDKGNLSKPWRLWLLTFSQAIGITAIASGGTGLSSAPANGQLLIGNAGAYSLNTLTPGAGIGIVDGAGTVTITNTGVSSAIAGNGISLSAGSGAVTITNSGVTSLVGTTHQVNVSNATGTVTLSTPQNIDTSSTPSFAGEILTGLLTISSSVTSAAGSGTDIVIGATTQTTVGASGAASVLPANPLGYLVFFKGATKCAIPYYNG